LCTIASYRSSYTRDNITGYEPKASVAFNVYLNIGVYCVCLFNLSEIMSVHVSIPENMLESSWKEYFKRSRQKFSDTILTPKIYLKEYLAGSGREFVCVRP
jgi:hypothetical protein